MDEDKLEKVFDMLIAANQRKIERRLTKANDEIEAIYREQTAYYDGAYDAIKRVKELLRAEEGET